MKHLKRKLSKKGRRSSKRYAKKSAKITRNKISYEEKVPKGRSKCLGAKKYIPK